jgi:hypothetical protein
MAEHDYEAHPWLIGFDKKDNNQKIEALTEQVKYLENLIGTISVILLVTVSLFLVLMVISFVTGKVDIGIITSLLK